MDAYNAQSSQETQERSNSEFNQLQGAFMQARKIIVGVLCSIPCCIAMASDNYFYGGETPDRYYWIHEESVLNLDNGNTSFYIFCVNIDPKLPYDLFAGEVEVRCKSREVKEISITTFLKGKIKEDTKQLTDSWWRARPGSIGDRWRKVICDKSERDTVFHRWFSSQEELTEWTQNYLRAEKTKEKQNLIRW